MSVFYYKTFEILSFPVPVYLLLLLATPTMESLNCHQGEWRVFSLKTWPVLLFGLHLMVEQCKQFSPGGGGIRVSTQALLRVPSPGCSPQVNTRQGMCFRVRSSAWLRQATSIIYSLICLSFIFHLSIIPLLSTIRLSSVIYRSYIYHLSMY